MAEYILRTTDIRKIKQMEEVERDVGVDSNFSLGSQALLSR